MLLILKNYKFYLNQPFFCGFTSGDVLIFGVSSTLPLIIIKGTTAHKDKNNIQNK